MWHIEMPQLFVTGTHGRRAAAAVAWEAEAEPSTPEPSSVERKFLFFRGHTGWKGDEEWCAGGRTI